MDTRAWLELDRFAGLDLETASSTPDKPQRGSR
jgi:hypothetical protein